MCVYVCVMSVRVCVRVCVYMCVRIHTFMYLLCVYVCCVCVYVLLHVNLYGKLCALKLDGHNNIIVIDRLIIQRSQKGYARDIALCLRTNNGLNRQTGVGSIYCLQLNLMKPFPLRYAPGIMPYL